MIFCTVTMPMQFDMRSQLLNRFDFAFYAIDYLLNCWYVNFIILVLIICMVKDCKCYDDDHHDGDDGSD